MLPLVRCEISVPNLRSCARVLNSSIEPSRLGSRSQQMPHSVGLSRSYQCRLVTHVTGLTLKRFLTRGRLQAAKGLLQ